MQALPSLGEPVQSYRALESQATEDLSAWLSGLLHAADAGYAAAQYRLGRALLDLAGAGRAAIVAPYQTLPAPANAAEDTALGRRLIALAARRWPIAAGWIALYRTPIPPTTDERPAAMVLRGLAALARPIPDRAEALRWLGRAARTRDAAACFWLASVVREGPPDPVAEEAARQAMQAAAELGHLEAMTQLGLDLLHGDAPELGLAWLTRAAELNDPWAQYQLGLAYHRGVRAPWQPALALLWLGRAADAGNGHAHAHVEALAPLVPPGAPAPDAPAWFGYACEAGELDSPGALALMARCLESGRGTAKNEALALDLWLRAAQGHEPQAVAQLQGGLQGWVERAEASLEAHERVLGVYEVLVGEGHAEAVAALERRFGDLPSAQLALARRCEAVPDVQRAQRWYGRIVAYPHASEASRRLAGLRLARLRGGPAAREAMVLAALELVEAACAGFRFWAPGDTPSPALAAAVAPAARALRGLAEGDDEAAFQLAFLAAQGPGLPQDPAYAEAVMAGALRRGHPGACGLAAVLAASMAELARVAHFENDGPDPADAERKADQALAAAANLAEQRLARDQALPAPLPLPLAAAWRLATERLQALGPDGARDRPRMGVVDEGLGPRIALHAQPAAEPADAAACVPGILDLEVYGPLLAPGTARTVRAAAGEERDALQALACLHVAAAMAWPHATEQARGQALGMPVEHVAAARALATAWWRRREELGDFAEVRWAPAWGPTT